MKKSCVTENGVNSNIYALIDIIVSNFDLVMYLYSWYNIRRGMLQIQCYILRIGGNGNRTYKEKRRR